LFRGVANIQLELASKVALEGGKAGSIITGGSLMGGVTVPELLLQADNTNAKRMTALERGLNGFFMESPKHERK
jgi:hypothetical protein